MRTISNVLLFCSDKAERKSGVIAKRTETADFILLFFSWRDFFFSFFRDLRYKKRSLYPSLPLSKTTVIILTVQG